MIKSDKRRKIRNTLFFAVIFASLALSVTVGCASGTAPEEEWNKTFGGPENDRAMSVQQTSDGGYILAGRTESYGAGNYDFWLVKTDLNGNKQWEKTFGGPENDCAMSVQQTSDGGYILAGRTESYGAGDYDFWLVKTDLNGNKQWEKTFGGPDDDRAYSVQQTSDGGYILAGRTESYGAGDYDFWLVKTDSYGVEQWNKTFGGPDDDRANSVQQTSDDGYILAGYTRLAGSMAAWLVKTDSSGNEQWNRSFTPGIDAEAVQQTSDDGYIFTGCTWSYGAGGSDFWLVKTDSYGVEQWNKTFGGSGNDWVKSVQQTTDGGYIFTGCMWSSPAGWAAAWLVKTDSSGNEQWNKTFGGTSTDWTVSAQQTTDDGYILAGFTASYGSGLFDFWLIKVKGVQTISIFDTEPSENPYPSIMGTHKGGIKPLQNINVNKLYTYPCAGTGGHTESIELYENGEPIASGTWNGYQDDWHNITITPSVTLLAGHTYSYTIVTGSYPQIIHAKSKGVTGGTITCTSFVDANGRTYTDWIPAIRLEHE